jgi:hypothetical protein
VRLPNLKKINVIRTIGDLARPLGGFNAHRGQPGPCLYGTHAQTLCRQCAIVSWYRSGIEVASPNRATGTIEAAK